MDLNRVTLRQIVIPRFDTPRRILEKRVVEDVEVFKLLKDPVGDLVRLDTDTLYWTINQTVSQCQMSQIEHAKVFHGSYYTRKICPRKAESMPKKKKDVRSWRRRATSCQ
jgi:hypothetical protein